MAFSDKLELAMKKLSISRGELASKIGVDKSVAGRWVSGKVNPSSHNLAKISRLIATQIPEFTMLDWDRSDDEFAVFINGSGQAANAGFSSIFPLLPNRLADEARHAANEKTKAYEGFWLSTRPSSDLPGKFLHDVSYVTRNDDGMLLFRSGVEGFFYNGSAVMIQQQLYYFAADDEFGAISFGILSGVPRHRADLIEGVILTTLRDAGASPAASSFVMQRIENLTYDAEADEATFKKLVNEQAMVAETATVPKEIADRLHECANAPGMIRMLFANSISRGPVSGPGSLGEGPANG